MGEVGAFVTCKLHFVLLKTSGRGGRERYWLRAMADLLRSERHHARLASDSPLSGYLPMLDHVIAVGSSLYSKWIRTQISSYTDIQYTNPWRSKLSSPKLSRQSSLHKEAQPVSDLPPSIERNALALPLAWSLSPSFCFTAHYFVLWPRSVIMATT
ncbi:hypothetical protein IF1G_02812 [Cordyceps javanica]|uniref:Uncharacterized protein n=1 Tax=Cordyceps javanica TaxID=43265 RepID=A0A545VAI2_9HYPO|nr:hypothetical protein IF1G_02812 [Cordyceps javanica]